MLCRILLATVAVTCTLSSETITQANSEGTQRALKDLLCVLVLSGIQKEDLDMNLLKKLQRHNINADDINSNIIRQECQVNSSEFSLLKARKNNDNSSYYQHITTTTSNVDNSSKIDLYKTTTVSHYNTTTKATLAKDVSKDGFNESKENYLYEVENTKGHHINNTTTTATLAKDVSKDGFNESKENNLYEVENTKGNHINNTTTKAILAKDGFNESKKNNLYEVENTKDHHINIRSSVSDVTSTHAAKQFSEALMLFGEQKNLDNVMSILQTYLIGKFAKNNNTAFFKAFTTTQITTVPPTKSTEITTESKKKDLDLVQVLATFVFNKSVPVESQYKLNVDKNSEDLDNIETNSWTTGQPDEDSINDTETTTKLWPGQDNMSYKSNTAEITSSVDEDYQPPIQSKLEQMMIDFRTKSKRKPINRLQYPSNLSSLSTSQSDNIFAPYIQKTLKHGATYENNQQKQFKNFENYEYSKVHDFIKPQKSYNNVKNETAKSLHSDVIREIVDTVKDLVLEDLKKEILKSTETVSAIVTTTEKITTTISKKLVKHQINIPQATHVIKNFVDLLEQLESAKEFIVSPVKYDSSKEVDQNSDIRVEAKENKYNQIKPEIKPTTMNTNNCNKINCYMPNVATANGYKMPWNESPMQYFQQSYLNNIPIKMVPPLVSNPYRVQQPGGPTVNIPQGTPYNNKPLINIITPLNHTSVINSNQMQPSPITIQNSKEIPPLGIAVSSTLNRNIVMPMYPALMAALNQSERLRWEYIMKYGRNPDTRNEIIERNNKLSQYTKNKPNKQGSDRNDDNFNKQEKLTDHTKLSLTTFNDREQDKRGDSTVFASLLPNTRQRDRIYDPNMFTLPAVNMQERQRLIDFENYNLPNLNLREPENISGPKTFNSFDKQERDRIIDPTLITIDKTKDMAMNTDYKQQQAYDEQTVLSDIKSKVLYKERYKTDEYPGMAVREPLHPGKPDTPKRGNYDQLNVFNPRFLEANGNYPRDYNDFTKQGSYREYNDIDKERDHLYIPKKDLIPRQTHEIKGFHDKLERGDYYEKQDPMNEWHETTNVSQQYDVNANSYDEAEYSKTRIESRHQVPLTSGIRMPKFDDTHFKNFLKTQQKVNNMLESILATQTSSDFTRNIETI